MLLEKPRIPIREILLYGWWPGFVKILFYRAKGYRIGKGVSIGFGAVICGERVEIGDHTSIGFLTIIRGKEIRLGSYVQIGSMTFLDTPHIEIGEGTKINEQVFVGGLQFPDSRFVVGRNCQIMQMSFINPARSIVIGDDTGIGGHCLIFGHSSWLNQFEGYAADFAPIEIGSSVGLAWRTFVLPGAKIGNGTMVGANSLVSGTLPPRSMAVGFPARVVAGPPAFPRKVSYDEKVEMFRRIVAEMIHFLVGSGLTCEQDGDCYEIRKPNTGWRPGKTGHWRMQVTDGDVREGAKRLAGTKLDVFLSLCEIPDDVRTLLSARSTVWVDIANKEQPRFSNDLSEEVLNFFKRYGVRTLRCPKASVSGSPVEAQSD
jgi:acetyltransferase-like isoleucine patch superfamily enzyme